MWRQSVLCLLTGMLSLLATGLCPTGLWGTGCAVRAKDISDATPMANVTPGVSQRGPVEHLTLTIVYDNNAHDARLRTEWGFACLVETGQNTVLFDTGGKGDILMGNVAKLGVDPLKIEAIVDELRQLGVQQVAPCHCTGDRARQLFSDAFGTDCILSGVGQIVEL